MNRHYCPDFTGSAAAGKQKNASQPVSVLMEDEALGETCLMISLFSLGEKRELNDIPSIQWMQAALFRREGLRFNYRFRR
ncbi:MAG TPA: hypothetical protein VHB01_02895 [Nitrosospira sp.]|nr:hypothetical protein [Nitrosospira sp.]